MRHIMQQVLLKALSDDLDGHFSWAEPGYFGLTRISLSQPSKGLIYSRRRDFHIETFARLAQLCELRSHVIFIGRLRPERSDRGAKGGI